MYELKKTMLTRKVAKRALGMSVSLSAGLALVGGMPLSAAYASDILQSDIINKLKKPPLTRSLKSPPSMTGGEKGFLGTLGASRGIKFVTNKGAAKQPVYTDSQYKADAYKPQEIAKITKIVKKYELPKLEFKIQFEFGSADVSGASLPQVIELAKALSHPSLKGTRVILGGHTDAKGSDSFNQVLSQKRSDSVARLIVQVGGIDPSRLVPVGFGEHKLKNEFDPNASENRRVEVINISTN